MSERTPLAQAAAELLASVTPAVAPPDAATQHAELAAIRAELARATRRRRWKVRSPVIALAASLAIGVLALRNRAQAPVARAPEGGTTVTAAHGEVVAYRGSSRIVLSGGSTVIAGDVVTCSGTDCSASLTLPTGSHIVLGGAGTRVALDSLAGGTQILKVESGSARFEVEKLRPGERFVVKTIDAEVEVRGTIFRVTVVEDPQACVDSGRTRVEVAEGLVAVRHASTENLVSPGQHWPTTCVSAMPAAPLAPTPSVAPALPEPRPSASAQKKASTAGSDLTAQNALWADAVAAKKRGDSGAALAGFNNYLAKYPSGFLAEAAEVERMRLLTGSARVAAARAYVAKHPNGFARAEALAIIERGS